MKIRIKGNSVRFRLTQSEVRQLALEGQVIETTAFESATFTYAVMAKAEVSSMKAEFVEKTIALMIPKATAKDWFASEQIGHEAVQRLANGGELYLLLEKDFACLDATREDQSDQYPNPKSV